MLTKNAVSTGIIIPFPKTSKVPKRKMPSNSMDLRTVSGKSFINKFVNP